MADVPVIFLSAYGQEEIIAQGLRDGRRRLRGQALFADGACGEDQGGPVQAGSARVSPSRRKVYVFGELTIDYAELLA